MSAPTPEGLRQAPSLSSSAQGFSPWAYLRSAPSFSSAPSPRSPRWNVPEQQQAGSLPRQPSAPWSYNVRRSRYGLNAAHHGVPSARQRRLTNPYRTPVEGCRRSRGGGKKAHREEVRGRAPWPYQSGKGTRSSIALTKSVVAFVDLSDFLTIHLVSLVSSSIKSVRSASVLTSGLPTRSSGAWSMMAATSTRAAFSPSVTLRAYLSSAMALHVRVRHNRRSAVSTRVLTIGHRRPRSIRSWHPAVNYSQCTTIC